MEGRARNPVTGRKCWEDGQFRRFMAKVPISKGSGQRAQRRAAAFVLSLSWRFRVVSLGRVSSPFRSPDPGLHSWPSLVAPRLWS